MPDPTLGEYRLDQLEKQQKDFRDETKLALSALSTKLDELPDKLDARYALKSEMNAVDQKVEEDREAAKTKRTGVRALYVGLAIAGFGVFATAFVSFMVWVVQNIEHVQNLGGS